MAVQAGCPEPDRPEGHAVVAAIDFDHAVPLFLVGMVVEIADHLPFQVVGLVVWIAGIDRHPPVLEMRHFLLEPVHDHPADIGCGHSLENKSFVIKQFVHPGSKDIAYIFPGGFDGRYDQRGLIEGFLFQGLFLVEIEQSSDHSAETDADECQPQKKFGLYTQVGCLLVGAFVPAHFVHVATPVFDASWSQQVLP